MKQLRPSYSKTFQCRNHIHRSITNKTLTSRGLDANGLLVWGLVRMATERLRRCSKYLFEKPPATVRLHLRICFPLTSSGLRFGNAGADARARVFAGRTVLILATGCIDPWRPCLGGRAPSFAADQHCRFEDGQLRRSAVRVCRWSRERLSCERTPAWQSALILSRNRRHHRQPSTALRSGIFGKPRAVQNQFRMPINTGS